MGIWPSCRAGAMLCSALVLAACATIQPAGKRVHSSALPPATDTPSARYIASELARQPRAVSGFRLLTLSTNALLSRITLADHAKHSIDLQYYLFANDATGRIVAQRLLAAADRGVRVRLLLDHAQLGLPMDMLDALDAHPSIEVRLFNPFRTRDPSPLSKIAQLLVDGARLNRRMHNKAFIVDNRIAVIGGRNIGDDYFDASPETNFRDLDLVAIGPVVPAASRSFDEYWNGEAAIPVDGFPTPHRSTGDLAQLRTLLSAEARTFADSDYAQAAYEELPDGPTADRQGYWFWGEALLVADAPGKTTPGGRHEGYRVGPTLSSALASAQREVLLVSPYFLPDKRIDLDLQALTARGVSVSVLTNSLASTDTSAVYARYSRHRRALLEAGVKLYELKGTGRVKARGWSGGSARRGSSGSSTEASGQGAGGASAGGSSAVSLHAKAFVIDGQVTYVGSMNLDPRSALLNSEVALLVDSPGLAKAVTDYFRSASAPEVSYRLDLRGDAGEGRGTRRMEWVWREGGVERRSWKEPQTTVLQRATMRLWRMVPMDGLL